MMKQEVARRQRTDIPPFKYLERWSSNLPISRSLGAVMLVASIHEAVGLT